MDDDQFVREPSTPLKTYFPVQADDRSKLETVLADGRALLPDAAYTVDTKRRELFGARGLPISGEDEGQHKLAEIRVFLKTWP